MGDTSRPPDYRYADHSLPGGTAKIDYRRSILAVNDRLREKSIVGGRLREKNGRRSRRGKEEIRREEEEDLISRCRPRPHVVTARGSPARRPRPQAILLPLEETKLIPMRG
ncbi:hypothetical protein B296_00024819, partial [Ensete ventricosum]